MVGTIGGLIIGGVEAALMTRRSRGRHLGWRRLIWPALATMVCLALVLSAIVLAAPAFAIAAILAAGTIGACFAYQPWGESERCLMMSRVEWVKRTVKWINGRTPPKYSAQERHRRCSHRTLGRRARLEPEE
jgi:hypothetical protein